MLNYAGEIRGRKNHDKFPEFFFQLWWENTHKLSPSEIQNRLNMKNDLIIIITFIVSARNPR